MNLRLSLESHDRLVVHLREGDIETTAEVVGARPGIASLGRAIAAALRDGYGECFWPGVPGGQYWWMFRRDAETLETAVMWSRGGASGWQHVFRATDAAPWVRDRFEAEAARLGFTPVEP